MAEEKSEAEKQDLLAGCLCRVFWMMIGNAVLLFSAYYVAHQPLRVVGVADAVYWAIVGCLLVVRYVDIRHFHGLTTDGDPASMAHWRRYAVLLLVVSGGLWLVARSVGIFSA